MTAREWCVVFTKKDGRVYIRYPIAENGYEARRMVQRKEHTDRLLGIFPITKKPQDPNAPAT